MKEIYNVFVDFIIFFVFVYIYLIVYFAYLKDNSIGPFKISKANTCLKMVKDLVVTWPKI